MFLVAGLLLALTVVRWQLRRQQVAVAVLAVPLVVVMVLSWAPPDTLRARGPVWSDEVTTGRDACHRNPALLNDRFGVAPGTGWGVRMPCHLLVER